MGKKIDITGQRFGRLVAVEYSHKDKRGKSMWKCECDCGNKTVKNLILLRKGATKSCGCLLKECGKKLAAKFSGLNKTHGDSSSQEYVAWQNMKKRCFNSSSCDYYLYGARGITVCDRWLDYDNFLSDVGRKPAPNYQLDRIDNLGNYEPGNCRWVTPSENLQNSRLAKLTVDEVELIRCLHTYGYSYAQLSRLFNLHDSTIHNAVNGVTWKNASEGIAI